MSDADMSLTSALKDLLFYDLTIRKKNKQTLYNSHYRYASPTQL